MAYTYKKLTDVELVEFAVEPNLLIEDGGDIKKISASNIAVPQVKADWNEKDETSPAFILNKPDLDSVGGGANVVTYELGSGGNICLNGNYISAQDIFNEWNNGSILRLNLTSTTSSSILSVCYWDNSGTKNALIWYLDDNGELTSTQLW